MANIEKKKYEELSENAQDMVRIVDYAVEGSSMPVTIYLDIPVEDMADAMKYIIDTGWMSSDYVFARKMKMNSPSESVNCIGFATYEEFFTYVTALNHCTIDENDPLIIAKNNSYKENEYDPHVIHDGDVYIKLSDGTILSKQEWEEYKPKQLKK